MYTLVFPLLLLFIWIELGIANRIRSMSMMAIFDHQYKYFSTRMEPLLVATVSNKLNCKMKCLSQEQCQTANFRSTTNQCELFPNAPGYMGNISPSVGTIVFLVNTESREPQIVVSPPAPSPCSASCLNQSWISSSDLLGLWLFDGTFNDQTSRYNASPVNGPTFYANGVSRQAASFNATMYQYLLTSYIPLQGTSFTIDVWIYPTALPYLIVCSIFGLCTANLANQCLHSEVKTNSLGSFFQFGFWQNGIVTNISSLSVNIWMHVAFVYDFLTMTHSVYTNGVLIGSHIGVAQLNGSTSNATIGGVPLLVPSTGFNGFQGYMDKLAVSSQAKGPCEILELATLAARFSFDSGSPLTDFGPNTLTTTASSYTIISNGKFNEAIAFNGNNSYFQTYLATLFSISNQSFTISLWIQPQLLSGTLVHVSTSPNGIGYWCIPFIGFTSNGTLVVQIWNEAAITSIFSPILIPTGEPFWTHIVQTWSSVNGLRLYIDSTLVASSSSATTFFATGMARNYVTLGTALAGQNFCYGSSMYDNNSYIGGIDEFRMYSQELSSSDICALYNG